MTSSTIGARLSGVYTAFFETLDQLGTRVHTLAVGLDPTVANAVAALGTSNLATAQESVGTTAVQLVAARTGASGTGRSSLTIYNISGATIYLGNSGVTATTGKSLPVGQSITLQTQAAIYAITASGTASVDLVEQY